MKKLYEVLKTRPEHKQTGEFGIEIEVEGKDLVPVDNAYWRTEDDGSLRGRFPHERAEYVLKKPLAFDEVESALIDLAESQKSSTLDFSFRTSVHVHMNVLDYTIPQILNIIYVYLLMEEPMMTFCGRERKGNRFCLRIADAEGLLHHLTALFRYPGQKDYIRDLLQSLEGDRVRYASINIAALIKYGSLEFRGMKGTLDIPKLMTWISMLNEIKRFAVAHEDPVEVHEHIAITGVDTFARCILKNHFQCADYPRLIKEVQQNFSLTLDLPYEYHYSSDKPKKKEEKKEVKTFGTGGRHARIALPEVPPDAFARYVAGDMNIPQMVVDVGRADRR